MHIPLQSGSDYILKEMNRKYDTSFFKSRVEKIRKLKKDLSITTDVIVGFPGETEQMHQESLSFIRELGFTKVHTFPYSDRYGTVASKMKNKVDGNVKKKRVRDVLDLSQELESSFYSKFYGKVMSVLIEEEKDGYFIGHTSNFIKVKVKGEYNVHEFYDILVLEDNIIN